MTNSSISFERIRNFLEPDAHRRLLNWCLSHQEAFEDAGTRDSNGVTRVDREVRVATHALLDTDVRHIISRRIDTELPRLMASLRVRGEDWSKEINVAAHNDGAHFSRHTDISLGKNDAQSRRVSAIYYFHREAKGFEGGQLRLHSLLGNEFIDIEPEQNTLIAFPSFLAHEVLRVRCATRAFEDSRFAVNIWLHQRPPESDKPV